MIGDPLLTTEQPVRPPGVRHANPAHRTALILLALLCGALSGLYVVRWLNRDEMPSCIDLPYGANYHGWDDSWWYEGNLVGYSPQEDSECIRPA